MSKESDGAAVMATTTVYVFSLPFSAFTVMRKSPTVKSAVAPSVKSAVAPASLSVNATAHAPSSPTELGIVQRKVSAPCVSCAATPLTVSEAIVLLEDSGGVSVMGVLVS